MKNLKHPVVLSFICFSVFLTSQPGSVPPPSGTIAYIRSGKEIRLIEADKSNDRLLWTHRDAREELGLYDLAWRPDNKEVAFSSAHASSYSLYHSDLYGIKPDGSGFRKITNPPDHGEFGRYPKGIVTVTIRNTQVIFQQTEASSGVFIVYVAGADAPQQITLPPGSSKTIVFKSVADFGKKAQAIVAIWGKFRWFVPGVDVQAGRTVKAPDFNLFGNGIEYLGAFHPVWRNDGSEVSYRNGYCNVSRVPVNPLDGEFYFKPMFSGKHPLGSCAWDWGPTTALTKQIIYSENSGEESSIFRIMEGGTHPGTKLTAFSNIQYQLLYDLNWLPDGSGLLYSTVTLMRDAANIFKYDFTTRKTTQVTHLENAFARTFTISPDGAWLIYDRAKTYDDDSPIDLWIQKMDGSEASLFVKNGRNAAWKR